VAVIVGRLLRIPVVITSHGADVYGLRGRLWRALRKYLASRCEAVTVVSHDLAANLPGVTSRTGEAPEVISMGVDTCRFHPERRDEALLERLSIKRPFILFVGRLAEKKGVRYLLEAMPDVLRDFPDCTLVIVGDGPLRRELEALSGQLDISRHVRFVRAVPHGELPAYYATADAFVGPSIVASGGDTEAFGVVFVEAMASGCPVVASIVGGTKDIVVDGQTGLLVPERSPKAIADALRKVLGDEALRERLRTAGAHWARERFDQRVVADKYAQLLTRSASAAR
jgi:glycosyltransferase involved in cell wall biosynthesis